MVDARRDIRIRYIGDDATARATQSVNRNVASVGQQYQRLNSRIATTNQLIGAVTLGASSGNAVATLANLQDSTARLAAVTQTLAKDQAFVAATSKRMSLEIEGATSAFARLRVLQDAGALETGEAEEFLVGLSDAFARFGAGSGQRENVLYGLAQALGQGQLQAQELNQVVEPLPGLLNDIARAAGMTATEYRNLVKEGNTLSSVFKEDILGALRSYAGTAEKLSGNIRQTLIRLSNEYKQTLLVFNEPITAGVDQLGSALGGALTLIAANADLVADAVVIGAAAIGVAYGARALRAINTFTTTSVASSKRRIDATLAEADAYRQKAARDQEILATEERNVAQRQKAAAIAERTAATQATAAARTARAQVIARREDAARFAAEREASVQRAADTARQALANREAATARSARLRGEIALRESALAAARTDKQRARAQASLEAANNRYAASVRAVESAQRAEQTTANRAAQARSKQAEAAQKVRAAQAEQLAASTALRESRQRELAAQQGINAANTRRVATERDLVRAARASAAATRAGNIALRAQALASLAATRALNVLKGAYAFVGGGFGVAAIAATAILGVRSALLRQGEAVESAEAKLDSLRAQYTALTESSLQVQGLTFETDDLDEQQIKLVEGRRKIEEYQQALRDERDSAGFFAARLAQLKLNLSLVSFESIRSRRQVKLLDEKLAEIEDLTARIDEVKALARAQDSLTDSTAALREALVRSARDAADALAPLVTKEAELLDQIEKIREARKFEQDDQRLDQYTRAIRAAEEELNKITGVTAARERLKRAAEDQLLAQRKIIESLDTEEQKVNRLFGQQSRTLTIGIEVAEAAGNESVRERLLAVQTRLAAKREADITRIRREGYEERLAIAMNELDEETALAEKLAEAREKAQRMIFEADALSDPVGAAQRQTTALLNEVRERAERSAAIMRESALTVNALQERLLALPASVDDEDRIRTERQLDAVRSRLAQERSETRSHYAELQVLAAAGEQAIQNARSRVAEEARRARQQQATNVAAGAALFGGALENIKGEVGTYIQLTEGMSDAERKAAEQSNKTNEKRFRRNKKILQAQAIADTYAGANRALATGGFAGIANALAVIAFGLANVRRIGKSSLSGAGGGVGGGGGASGGGDTLRNNRIEAANVRSGVETGAQTIVVVASGSDPRSAVQQANDLLPALSRQLAAENIRVSGERLTLSDARFLRR